MRASNLAVLVIAIILGGVAAFLARNWLQSRVLVSSARAERSIVVAAKPLKFGEPLTTDTVAEVGWAAETLPDGSFATIKDLLKDGRRVALASFGRNEPIVGSKITGPGQRASLSTMLDGGKRAITIRVDDVRGVAGFILPGDHVDVALIRSDNGRRYSDLLLQNAKVVAIDQIASEQRDKPTVAKAVTLEVTPQQAQKISLATDVGRLSLILRQAGELDTVADSRVTEADLGAAEVVHRPELVSAPLTPPEEKAVPVEKPAVRPDIATVTIVRNLKGLEYRVVRDSKSSAGARSGSSGITDLR